MISDFIDIYVYNLFKCVSIFWLDFDYFFIDFIRCFCPEGGTVLDPFVGSGTTLIAAVNNDRDCLGIDISKEYCELSEKRLKLEYQKMNDFF